MPIEDEDAAAIVERAMMNDGVRFVYGSGLTAVDKSGDEKRIRFTTNDSPAEIIVDEILVGVGRVPNVEGLGLDLAGVDYDTKNGVKVNDRLQTSNSRIFAAGDICFPLKFTHAADAMAQIVIQNALFPHPFGLGYAKTDSLTIPWCTYTSPEIAHVGVHESLATAAGTMVDTFTVEFNEIDRAILDGEAAGFARVHVERGSDKILGATIVGAHAGELISQFALAIKNGLGLSAIGGTIYPYPTRAEVIKKVANAWRKTTLTRGKKRLLNRLFAWTR